mmetsp:Transcript_1248/g.4083  ORF Transcript_1248/g.4083 Transcript_1248/m.4083 type:complete len:252 (-) Transcript_1248:577-1332(-)
MQPVVGFRNVLASNLPFPSVVTTIGADSTKIDCFTVGSARVRTRTDSARFDANVHRWNLPRPPHSATTADPLPSNVVSDTTGSARMREMKATELSTSRHPRNVGAAAQRITAPQTPWWSKIWHWLKFGREEPDAMMPQKMLLWMLQCVNVGAVAALWRVSTPTAFFAIAQSWKAACEPSEARTPAMRLPKKLHRENSQSSPTRMAPMLLSSNEQLLMIGAQCDSAKIPAYVLHSTRHSLRFRCVCGRSTTP